MRKIIGFILLAFVGWILLQAVVDMNKGSSATGPINTPSTQPVKQTIVPPSPIERMKLSSITWQRGGFGSIALGSFTIENQNDFAVKDIELICRFFGNSGTQISRIRATVYERVEAKKSKRVRDFNFGFVPSQATSGSCDLAGVS